MPRPKPFRTPKISIFLAFRRAAVAPIGVRPKRVEISLGTVARIASPSPVFLSRLNGRFDRARLEAASAALAS